MNFLVEYQKQLGLDADGVMGPATAKAMMLDLSIIKELFFAHMMGQVAHESGRYKNDRENLNYSKAGLLSVFPKYYSPHPTLASIHERKPERIANYVYANRMGNGDENSGDGWKYRGIFGLQLTGKDNIQKFMKYAGIDTSFNPETLLDNPRNYFLAGKFWFEDNGVDKLCTSTSDACVLAVTKRVNGGTNGLQDRKDHTKAMFKVLGLK